MDPVLSGTAASPREGEPPSSDVNSSGLPTAGNSHNKRQASIAAGTKIAKQAKVFRGRDDQDMTEEERGGRKEVCFCVSPIRCC